MKKYIACIVLSLMAFVPVLAQQPKGDGRRQFNPDEFKARLEAYIRDKVGLSQAEGDKLFPIYFEMKEKQLGINHAIMKLKRTAAPQNGGSCPNYCEIVTQITNLNVELAKIEQTYYPKMCKVVDAKKVFDLMLAEDAFHREMLRMAGPRGGGSHGGVGMGGRGGQNWGAPRGGRQPQNK